MRTYCDNCVLVSPYGGNNIDKGQAGATIYRSGTASGSHVGPVEVAMYWDGAGGGIGGHVLGWGWWW